jgi:PilZ domain
MGRVRESLSSGRPVLYAASVVVAVARAMHLSSDERVSSILACLDRLPESRLRDIDREARPSQAGSSAALSEAAVTSILHKLDDVVVTTRSWCRNPETDDADCCQQWQQLSATILKYLRMSRPHEVWASPSRRAQIDRIQELLFDVSRGLVPRIEFQAALTLINPSERRRHERVELDVPVVLWLRNRPIRCTTTDVSVRGCKVLSSFETNRDEDVVVQFANGLRVPSQVAWCSIEAIGVKFKQDIQISRLIPEGLKR